MTDLLGRIRVDAPYIVQRSPSGAVVICMTHLVTEEIKAEEAQALATALNQEHQRRHMR